MRRLIPLIVTACVACTPQAHPVEIRFDVRLNGAPISCTTDVNGIRLTDLRFYVSDVRVADADGGWQPLAMQADDTWQNESLALIDLENGQGACLNGSTEQNAVIRGTVSSIPGSGIAFTVGVPADLNHADPLRAGAPLGYTEMHWHWASGYKFMRAGLETDDDGFFLHLGSNRCAGTIGDIKGCQGANRATIRLADFRAGDSVVIVDIGTLFAAIDLQDGSPGECMSGPANDECAAPFRALGIDFLSGAAQAGAPAIQMEPRR